MKIRSLTILSFCFILVTGIAQKQKSKSVRIVIPSYPTEQPVKDMESYAINFLDKAQRALPFNEEELQKALNFESFSHHVGDETPDLFFGVQGVGVNDVRTTIKRYASKKRYEVYTKPKENTKFSIMLLVDGEPRQILDFLVPIQIGQDKKAITTVTTFSFDEAEKYLDFRDVDNAKPTPTLIKDFLQKYLGKDYLTKTVVPKLKAKYDYGSEKTSQAFYYIKDKKNKPVIEESKKKVVELYDNIFSKINTLEDLRDNKALFDPYIAYWKDLYEKYKSTKKPAWAMLMNLHNTAMITEDVALAEEYLNKLVALETKSWATGSAKKRFKRFKERYDINHNVNGERIYAEAYKLDKRIGKVLQSEEAKKKAQANDIVGAAGYVISSKDEKFEGEVTLKFSKEEKKQQGTIVSLDGEKIPGKSVSVKYKNAKGKTRFKELKAKKVKEVVVGDKVYKPINPETDGLQKVANALNFAFSNVFLMKELYKSEKVGVYLNHKDDGEGVYYLKFPSNEKAQRIKMNSDSSFVTSASELFKNCASLVERLKKGEFKNTEKDLVAIAKLYSECQ